jgi:transketolase
VIGINRFGESAPAAQVYDVLGITKEALAAAV